MVVLDGVDLPSMFSLALVASGLRLVSNAFGLPERRRSSPTGALTDLEDFEKNKNDRHTRRGKNREQSKNGIAMAGGHGTLKPEAQEPGHKGSAAVSLPAGWRRDKYPTDGKKGRQEVVMLTYE